MALEYVEDGKIYRNIKTSCPYRVLMLAKHSETLEPMVVYRRVNDTGDTWVRPLGLFLEKFEEI